MHPSARSLVLHFGYQGVARTRDSRPATGRPRHQARQDHRGRRGAALDGLFLCAAPHGVSANYVEPADGRNGQARRPRITRVRASVAAGAQAVPVAGRSVTEAVAAGAVVHREAPWVPVGGRSLGHQPCWRHSRRFQFRPAAKVAPPPHSRWSGLSHRDLGPRKPGPPGSGRARPPCLARPVRQLVARAVSATPTSAAMTGRRPVVALPP